MLVAIAGDIAYEVYKNFRALCRTNHVCRGSGRLLRASQFLEDVLSEHKSINHADP